MKAIENLIQIFLMNNLFIFDEKFYRVYRGCLMNLPLFELLVDIYLQDWQQVLVRHTYMCW